MKNSLLSLVDRVKNLFQTSRVSNLSSSYANNVAKPMAVGVPQAQRVVQNVGNYFNPADQNRYVDAFFNKVSNIPRYQLPQNFLPQTNNKVMQFGQNLVRGAIESPLNIPRNLVTGYGRIQKENLNLMRGRGYNFGNTIAGVGNIAEAGLDLGTFGIGMGTFGIGKSVAKGAIKQTAKSGAMSAIKRGIAQGATVGAVGGGAYGVGNQYNKKFNVGEVAMGAGAGALIGGALGGSVAGIGSLWKQPDYTPEVLKYLRDAQGKFRAGDVVVKPPKMPQKAWDFQLKVNKQLGRNLYTPVYPSDLPKVISKQPLGASVKKLTKFEHEQNVANAGLYDRYYHGSPVANIKEIRATKTGNLGAGVYLSKKPEVAREASAMQYEGNLADINLYETKLKNSNLFKTTESSLEDSQIAQIKKQGYAGIETPYETVIFNLKDVQLIKMTPANVVQQPIGDALQPLMQEAKKHKTADEFGQAMWQKVQDTGNLPGNLDVRDFASKMNPDFYPNTKVNRPMGGWFDDLNTLFTKAKEQPFSVPKGVGEVTTMKSVVNQMPQVSTKTQSVLPTQPKVRISGINEPIRVGETLKQQEGQLGQTLSPVSEQKIPLQGAGSSDNIISSLKSKANRIYTDVIDRFNPLSKTAKLAKEDQKMRNALTGHYGAGSTAQYHVDFELSPILKEQNINDLRSVAIVQRDVELAGRGIKGSNTGSSIEALKTEMGTDKFKAVQATLDKLYKYQDEMVKKYLVDKSIISKSAYDAMRAKNQFYVPYKRVMDEVDDFLGFVPQTRSAGSVSSQNVVFKIKGSEKQIIDPIESILESTYKMVGLGKRQEVAKTIVSLKDKLPAGMVEKVVGNVGNRPTISLFENGKVQKYLVPADVAEAAKGLSEESLNSIIKILSVPTQIFRATATGINPEFMAPNVARDVQSAFVNVGLNPLKWVSGLAHMMKKDEVYQEFLKAGGKTSRISIDRPMLTNTVAGITSKKGFAISKPSDLLKILQSAGEYSEQPTRIAVFEQEFVKGLKKGLSQEEAATRAAGTAQDATVNFARRGAKTQSVNAIYAFLNARAQGVDRLVRTLRNDPVGGAFRIGLITQVPALAGYAWNRQFDSYYDDRVVSPADKRTNFIIMLSDTPIPQLGGAQFVKIPKGDIGKLANPTEEFLRFADNKGGDVKKAMFDVIKGFSPWDNMGDLIPTALRPPVEATVNKSFFTGYPIVPEYKTGLPAKYQDSSYTAPLYRMIGQKLNVSPAKLQAIIEGYGTGIAKIGEMSTRGLIPDKYVTAKNEQGADINKTPIIRRFLGGEKRTQEEQTQSNISRAKSIDFRINDVKSAVKRGDMPQDEGIREIEKLQAEQDKIISGVTSTPKTTSSNTTWIKTTTGGLKEIDLSFPLKTYTPTGNATLDKELLTDYKGSITKAKNNVMEAWQAGAITKEEAIVQLEKLVTISNKTKKPKKPKKPKAVSFRKIAAKKIAVQKVSNIKISKPKLGTLKIKKTPTFKMAKSKQSKVKFPTYKAPKFKIKKTPTLTIRKGGSMLGTV